MPARTAYSIGSRSTTRRSRVASANQLDDAGNRVYRPATAYAMRAPSPARSRPQASDAVSGHGVRSHRSRWFASATLLRRAVGPASRREVRMERNGGLARGGHLLRRVADGRGVLAARGPRRSHRLPKRFHARSTSRCDGSLQQPGVAMLCDPFSGECAWSIAGRERRRSKQSKAARERQWTKRGADHLREDHAWSERHGSAQQMSAMRFTAPSFFVCGTDARGRRRSCAHVPPRSNRPSQ